MSVELQKIRNELMREALLKGWHAPELVEEPWKSMVPRERLTRWYSRLYAPSTEPLLPSGRLLNHFCLGADPEFVITDRDGMTRVDARGLNLKAGPAFGADNNGRLVELRPAPSRNALEVLASLYRTLRWMAVYHPDATVYSWRGGAYFANDGLGGHIHFGRKSEKLREREISVLDRLTHLQYVAGIFNREEGRLRVRQSQGAPSGHYGALGDIRKQPHGYEYRTLPSWIDNPWLSYFNLVIAKLAVARPEMVPGLTEADGQLTAEQARGQLKMLIAYYAPLDDDARLALHILSRIGFPRANVGTDIKTSWGVYGSGGPLGTKTRSKPSVIPTMIPGMQEDFHSLVDAMVTGGVPEEVPLEPTWTPSELPEGYQCAIDLVDTKQAPGLGEFVSDLCYYSGYKIRIFNLGHGGNMFSLSRDWYEALADSELARSGLSYGVCEERQVTLYINASKDFELPVLMAARERLIHSGVLPLWFITEVTEGSFARWNSPKRRRPKSPPKTSRSTQLYPTKEEF